MSIMDIFKAADTQQQAAPQQPAQPTPGNIPAQQQDNNGQVPGQAPKQEENNDPLAQYKDLWDAVPNEGSNDPTNFVPLDANKLQEVVGKASFTNAVTPDQLKAIAGGGDDAMTAFKQTLDQVARQVMIQSTMASNKMTEQAVAKAMAASQAKFPSMLKEHNTLAANPLFSNPAVKPVIEAVRSQLSNKYPDASSQELAKMAENFITAMGESFSPKPPSDTPNDFDWSTYLDS